ncbi:MAG: hypothetical protein KTR25_11145 [Myxococcales bacterium]|nr:hypothetical protein [Myxococcales bacterium]
MKSLRLSAQAAPQTAEVKPVAESLSSADQVLVGPQKTEVAMAERLASLEPGSKRHETLEIALDFKRSWFRLASFLAEIRAAKLYREWGYRTFEAYGKHELHLKKETLLKLVRSYDFLHQHERTTLEQVERSQVDPQALPTDLPSYQALDILAEARQNPHLPEDEYRALRDQVFRDDPPPSTLRKLVKERAPEPPKAALPEEPGRRLRKALGMAERLYGLLLEEQVPEGVQRSAEELVGKLRRLIED